MNARMCFGTMQDVCESPHAMGNTAGFHIAQQPPTHVVDEAAKLSNPDQRKQKPKRCWKIRMRRNILKYGESKGNHPRSSPHNSSSEDEFDQRALRMFKAEQCRTSGRALVYGRQRKASVTRSKCESSRVVPPPSKVEEQGRCPEGEVYGRQGKVVHGQQEKVADLDEEVVYGPPRWEDTWEYMEALLDTTL